MALSRNPPPELRVLRILVGHEAVAELCLEFAQLLKLYAPKSSTCCLQFESNTLELLNAFRCHGTWLSFMIRLVDAVLSQNPLPELRVLRILAGHEAVAGLQLELTQLSKL